jgi:hypothetical protein
MKKFDQFFIAWTGVDLRPHKLLKELFSALSWPQQMFDYVRIVVRRVETSVVPALLFEPWNPITPMKGMLFGPSMFSAICPTGRSFYDTTR